MGPGQQSWLTSQRSIRAGSQTALDRAGFGPVWARLTRTRGVLWRCHVTALGLHWAVVFGCGRERGSRWTQVHGPWTADRSTVVRVHPSSLRRGPCAPSSRVCGRRGEKSSVSPAAVLSPAASSLVSPRGGVGVQLRRGILSSCRGDCDGGVKVAAKASQGAGHGERRLEHNRRAGVARVQRHRPGLWCA